MSSLLFPSLDWLSRWVELVNEDQEFRKAGVGWDGSVACEIKPDEYLAPPSMYIRLSGTDGHWQSYDLGHSDRLAADVRFALAAPYAAWKEVIEQRNTPVRGLIQGKLRVRGQLSLVLRWAKAMTIMTQIAGRIETDFLTRAS